MTAVLEQVEERHCGRGKFVNIEDFELALEEVEGYQDAGKYLSGGWRGRCIGVEIRAGEEGEDVDKERPGVFDDKDGFP